MKTYKKLTIFTGLLAIVTFVAAIILHYGSTPDDVVATSNRDFWINVCLALFGSGALTFLTSIVTYHFERIKTMESFLCHTRQILARLNRYKEQTTLEEKIRFFLDYHDFDISAWDSDFGSMDFFFDRGQEKWMYIYYKIYLPILQFGAAVDKHVWHFRWHVDGTATNEAVMKRFVGELEDYLIKREEKVIPTVYDENGTPTAFCKQTMVEPKLVLEIKRELAGHYYDMIYGKRIAKKTDKAVQDKVEERDHGNS